MSSPSAVPRKRCSTTSTRRGRASAISHCPTAPGRRSILCAAPRLTVRAARDLADPTTMIPSLASYVRLATRAASGVTCTTLDALNAESQTCDAAHGDLALALRTTLARSSDALLNAAGVVVEATAPREYVGVGEAMPVTVTLYNQGKVPVVFESVSLDQRAWHGVASAEDDSAGQHREAGADLQRWFERRRSRGGCRRPRKRRHVPAAAERDDRRRGSARELGHRRRPCASQTCRSTVRSGPIVYRFADPARGEVRRPIATIPEKSRS